MKRKVFCALMGLIFGVFAFASCNCSCNNDTKQSVENGGSNTLPNPDGDTPSDTPNQDGDNDKPNNEPDDGNDVVGQVEITFTQYLSDDVSVRIEKGTSLSVEQIPTILTEKDGDGIVGLESVKWSVEDFSNVQNDIIVEAQYFKDGQRAYVLEYALSTQSEYPNMRFEDLNCERYYAVCVGETISLPSLNVMGSSGMYESKYWTDVDDSSVHLIEAITDYTYNFTEHKKIYAVIQWSAGMPV